MLKGLFHYLMCWNEKLLPQRRKDTKEIYSLNKEVIHRNVNILASWRLSGEDFPTILLNFLKGQPSTSNNKIAVRIEPVF